MSTFASARYLVGVVHSSSTMSSTMSSTLLHWCFHLLNVLRQHLWLWHFHHFLLLCSITSTPTHERGLALHRQDNPKIKRLYVTKLMYQILSGKFQRLPACLPACLRPCVCVCVCVCVCGHVAIGRCLFSLLLLGRCDFLTLDFLRACNLSRVFLFQLSFLFWLNYFAFCCAYFSVSPLPWQAILFNSCLLIDHRSRINVEKIFSSSFSRVSDGIGIEPTTTTRAKTAKRRHQQTSVSVCVFDSFVFLVLFFLFCFVFWRVG